MTCGVCGSPLPDGARFCPSCGAVVSQETATSERKIVTVLFADLVDSTGLSQRLDPERAREVLGRFYDVTVEELVALRGKPEKFIGDAVMAVFGLPRVHEDDALRAVRAGLAIRSRVGRLCEELGLPDPLQLRIGIESGEAATGRGPEDQVLVTGSVVNSTARLQSAAAPGEILVGRTTRVLVQNDVSLGSERQIDAKGFAEPLSASSVTAVSPVATPARAASPSTPASAPRAGIPATSSSADRTARSASSSRVIGVPQTAITASPMNFSIVPP